MDFNARTTSLTMRSHVPYVPRGVSHSRTMVYFERVAQLCYHAILEVRGGITHPHTRHPHSLAPIEQVLSRNLGCASLGCLQGNEIDTVASARRSGQEDFQRGTPPVSLASRSISVELVLSRSDPQKTTRQTARGHQSWSPCYCSTSTCDYMETLRLGTFLWGVIMTHNMWVSFF